MSAVLKTLWFIETRFRDNELSLEMMAEHAGVSRSHLSRIFAIVTGRQLSAYLRGRRLTEAARELANGAPHIINVALDAGYGSHAAFTRSFRDQFGLTPDELRRRRTLDTLELVEPLCMTSHIWQRFGPYLPEMRSGGPPPAFGVVGATPEGVEGFDYFAAAPLPAGRDLLPGLTEMTLPAGSYARFSHAGHISGIRATCGAVFETGVPALGREPDTRWFSFLEYYGPDFEPSTGRGTVEIWVKLRQ